MPYLFDQATRLLALSLPLERTSKDSRLASVFAPITLNCVESASTAVVDRLCSVRTLRPMVLPAGKVFKIKNLSDVDATLLEPASCACHGLEKIAPKLGSTVLMFGAGPTGLCLAQLLRHNGGSHVVIAAPEGLKMDLAKKLDAADEYIELSRINPGYYFETILTFL